MEQTYNIEHLVDIKVPSSVVFGALTTAEGLAEVWTRELIITCFHSSNSYQVLAVARR